MTLLTLDAVSRVYAMRRGWLGRASTVRAVDDVSLSLAPGRTLGIVGESGCGKSTTGRLALGLEPPDGGSVHFDGTPMPPPGAASWRTMRRRLQLVPQDPLGALDRRLSAIRQIAEPLAIHDIGAPGSERADRVAALLDDVGLRPDQAARVPHRLSGGQRQRVVLARALATDPDLLVCDEPVSALDVSIQAQIVNLLMALQERRTIAMLFICHDLRIVRQVSHDVAVMYLGRIVEQGDPDDVFIDPAHPYTRALVGSIPGAGKRIVLQGDPPNPAQRPPGCAFHPRCPAAIARCRAEIPALKPLPGAGRLVACHVAQDEAERAVSKRKMLQDSLP